MTAIPFSQNFKPHQYATVPAGSADVRIFYGKIPNGCVGFISKVANNWCPDTYLTWKIDGMIVEKQIERMIGSLDQPAEYNESNGGFYPVQSYVEFTATNNTASDLEFTVLCDGFMKMRRR